VGEKDIAMIHNRSLKVTVMIPTYNQSAYVKQAIGSALSQIYPDLEVVVGDDASTDNTPKIVKNIKDKRLKYVRNPSNLGRTGNYRNLLYNHATGDYVVNLDGDDYFTDPDFISEAVKRINASKNVIMVVARVTTKTNDCEVVSDIPDIKTIAGMEILRKLPDPEYLIKHMAAVYARSPAIRIGFYRNYAVSSDWESLYRLCLRGNVEYLDRKVGVWRIHEANETKTIDLDKHASNLQIWHDIYKDAVIFGMNPVLAHLISSKCIAFFAIMSCMQLAVKKKTIILKFLMMVFNLSKTSIMIILFTPRYLATVIFSLTDYYLRKSYR
jgi:glycosyltransferase involved in cell wall biosynthesis